MDRRLFVPFEKGWKEEEGRRAVYYFLYFPDHESLG